MEVNDEVYHQYINRNVSDKYKGNGYSRNYFIYNRDIDLGYFDFITIGKTFV